MKKQKDLLKLELDIQTKINSKHEILLFIFSVTSLRTE